MVNQNCEKDFVPGRIPARIVKRISATKLKVQIGIGRGMKGGKYGERCQCKENAKCGLLVKMVQ